MVGQKIFWPLSNVIPLIIEEEIEICDDEKEVFSHSYFHRNRVYELIAFTPSCEDDEDLQGLYPEGPEDKDGQLWESAIELYEDNVLWDLDFTEVHLSDEAMICASVEGEQGSGYFCPKRPKYDDVTLRAAIRYLLEVTEQEDKAYERLTNPPNKDKK